MSKTVTLLTNFTTARGGKRATLPANSTQTLTKEEWELLDRLTLKTGRPHYRMPINESAQRHDLDDDDDGGLDLGGAGDKGDGGKAADEAKALDDMTVKELKTYLDGAPATPYSPTDTKPVLLELAKAKQAAGGGTNEDAMGGL